MGKLKRKSTGTWVNTGMFVQVWSAIKADERWKKHNWVCKVDADAVFFPNKLINALRHATVPQEGVYMENCKYVEEVYSDVVAPLGGGYSTIQVHDVKHDFH